MFLRRIRILISSLFFFGFVFIFFFYNNISLFLRDVLTYFQFIPSLLSFFNNTFILAGTGFITVIIMTFLFGRLYCSMLCPFGTMQDIAIFFSKKNKNSYLKPYNYIKYSILFFTILSGTLGVFVLVILLDPYSIFGRIMSGIFVPFRGIAGNKLIEILRESKIYINYSFKIHKIGLIGFALPLIYFFVISVLSFLRGRVYCNIICPVGTFLGILSKISFLKISLDKNKCVSCMKCEKVCKAGCIDAKNKTLDFSRCIDCFNCLDLCPGEAINYGISRLHYEKESGISRRKFLFNLLSVSALLFGSSGIFLRKRIGKLTLNKNRLITPPGSIGVNHFITTCTACYLCVASCPTKVLRPFVKNRQNGKLQPGMDYSQAFCDYECTICSTVCPTGAIKYIELDRKKRTQIGVTDLIKDKCIVYDKHQDCGACAEHCPTKAVFMVPYKGIYGPETNADICIGCGACENVCPALPEKAIIVEKNVVHKYLDINPEKIDKKLLIDEKENGSQDFPF